MVLRDHGCDWQKFTRLGKSEQDGVERYHIDDGILEHVPTKLSECFSCF